MNQNPVKSLPLNYVCVINKQRAETRDIRRATVGHTVDSRKLPAGFAGQSAADNYVRLLVECFARKLSPNENLARYREDALAIPLPGCASIEAHQLAIRLSEAGETLLGKIFPSMSPMSILSARPEELSQRTDVQGRKMELNFVSNENELVAFT